MAVAGSWKAQPYKQYAGARKWGTGWHPIHAVSDNDGRDIAPQPETVGSVHPDITGLGGLEYGYTEEDFKSSQIWGYGSDTGLSDRPRPGEDDRGDTIHGYPPYGPYTAGLPGGTQIRTVERGADATSVGKEEQPSAADGWFDKVNSNDGVNAATPSDQSQYEMQTSMTQLLKVREGSQSSGRASTFTAPIESPRPTWGQKSAIFSTPSSYRHGEMVPREQTMQLRAWRYRTAGTDLPAKMLPNAEAPSYPLTRNPAPNPYTGPTIGQGVIDTSIVDESNDYYV